MECNFRSRMFVKASVCYDIPFFICSVNFDFIVSHYIIVLVTKLGRYSSFIHSVLPPRNS